MKESYAWSVTLTDGTDVKTPIVFIGEGSGKRSADYVYRLMTEQGIALSSIKLDLVLINHPE